MKQPLVILAAAPATKNVGEPLSRTRAMAHILEAAHTHAHLGGWGWCLDMEHFRISTFAVEAGSDKQTCASVSLTYCFFMSSLG